MTHIQPARGNAAKNDAATLPEGVITVDTTNKSIRVHDGTTAGGHALLPASLKGQPDGVASLGSDGKVPAAQLPSYVDDVLEYASLAAFPATGQASVIYVAQDSNKTYRWSGSAYVEISPSPGSTDAVPEGASNLYFTAARAQAAVTSVTGNAGTATKLQTARTINGVSFDGTANITVADSTKLPTSGGTATDTQLNGMRVRAASAQSGTAFAVNYANGDYFKFTATGNTTVTLSNFPAGLVACGVIEAVNWGGKTITFPTGTKIVGGSLSLTASGTDLLGLVWDGAIMRVTLMAKDVK